MASHGHGLAMIMLVSVELTIPCSSVEEILKNQYHINGPVELTRFERDDLSDVLGFTFELDEEDSNKICRDWDEDTMANDIVEELI